MWVLAAAVMGFLNPWKELASFQTGIRGSDEQVTKPDEGILNSVNRTRLLLMGFGRSLE